MTSFDTLFNLTKRSSFQYVLPHVDNLTCPICCCPFIEPVETKCNHYFCRKCFTQAMSYQGSPKNCPTCRAILDQSVMWNKAPNILHKILDDLMVICPLQSRGCATQVQRSTLQDHLEKYCDFIEVECPSRNCHQTIPRKELGRKRCLHGTRLCLYCKGDFVERDHEDHQKNHCRKRCRQCQSDFPPTEWETHQDECLSALKPCPAAAYGRDVITRRSKLDSHTQACPLAKLTPVLQAQNGWLEIQEAQLRSLRQYFTDLETSSKSAMANLLPVTLLNPSLSTPLQRENLEELQRTQRTMEDRVNRIPKTVTQPNSGCTMMALNDNIKLKEEVVQLKAAMGGLRLQVDWLVNDRVRSGPPPA